MRRTVNLARVAWRGFDEPSGSPLSVWCNDSKQKRKMVSIAWELEECNSNWWKHFKGEENVQSLICASVRIRPRLIDQDIIQKRIVRILNTPNLTSI